jgi:hypothetical protein
MVKEYGMSEGLDLEEASISTVIEEVLAGNVEAIEVYGNDLLVRTKVGRQFRSRKEADFSLVEFLRQQGTDTGANGVQVSVKGRNTLGGLGLRTFGHREDLVFLGRMMDDQKDYGDTVADEIDHEIRGLVDGAHSEAVRILTENRPKLVQIAQRLMVDETLEGEALESLFNEPVPVSPEEAPAAEGEPIEALFSEPVPVSSEEAPAAEDEPIEEAPASQ